MKRTFIAIDIPLNQRIIDFITKAKSMLKDSGIKWIQKEQIHLTIKFLGETDNKRIDDTHSVLSAISKNYDPFELIIQNAGIFKNIRIPRIIWLGIRENDILNSLNKEINSQLSVLGFAADQKLFKPHLTVGRIKFLNDVPNLSNLLEQYGNFDFHRISVNEIIFYESLLKPEGAEYLVIKKYKLGKN